MARAEPPRTAIIIGGGPCGLLTALALTQRSHMTCTVFELCSSHTTFGGAIGIPPSGLQLFGSLGVLEGLLARGNASSKLVWHSLCCADALGPFDMAARSKETTGYGCLRIKRTDMLEVLLEAVAAAGIVVHFGQRLPAIYETHAGVVVSFDEGVIAEATADILLGCDGIHAAVRVLYVNPDRRPMYTGSAGLMGLASAALLTSESADTLRDGIHATMTCEGTFMTVPCRTGSDEFYWAFQRKVPSPNQTEWLNGWDIRSCEEIEELKDVLYGILTCEETHGGKWAAILCDLIDATREMRFYPVYQLPSAPGNRWYRGRILLLGDAAHAMPPHAGQGICMVLEDATLLANLLSVALTPSDTMPEGDGAEEIIGDLFRRYEQGRRSRVEDVARWAIVVIASR
ncbi:6-hydroxynicotinate 3-monooxygenase [Cyphellophora attinorum]|uniref:6-hydroxynicotinate 3-monooxygenase n=1 Tax=Cyphellophora attinorum TaxID=1664694 RepID=A0A0N1GWZ6_9EURO|nr:6-hydroxynicotinate 3-monooxygenase [Phialophora attinorum]KPI34497.1 6-hydroxynicotinate 3-monooxygenase [Phialophora attinorum]